MRFDLITIFPEFFAGPLEHGIIRRACGAGLIQIHVQDLREFAPDKHRTVDDRPFGGGEGMVLKPEPLFAAVEALRGTAPVDTVSAVVLLSAAGKLFRQADARRLAQMERVVLICGRYEGVDERVAEHLASDEYSIGDFVLSGGELPAAMIVDAVTRLIPGALGNEDSAVNESFSESEEWGKGNGESRNPLPLAFTGQPSAACSESSRGVTRRGILDYPHYTRPPEFRGWAVPEVLLGGNHAAIRRWRRQMALAKTLRNRPELLAGAELSTEDRQLLNALRP
jgi:tRNA (guanine37-N1)-methyltransferase